MTVIRSKQHFEGLEPPPAPEDRAISGSHPRALLSSIYKPESMAENIRALLDSLPLMLCVVRQDTGDSYFNSAWRDYTGIQSGEVISDGMLQWTHPDDRQSAFMSLYQSQTTDTDSRFECRLRHHMGTYRWFAINVRLKQNEEDGIIRYYVTCTDIHEKVLKHHSLENSLRLQSRMLDTSVDCIKVVDIDGLLRHMNRPGCLALGVTENQAATGFGMKWLDLLPKEVRRRGQRALNIAKRGGYARFAGLSIRPGKKPQYWDNILTPMKDKDGAVSEILCLSRDVTLQREAAKRLKARSETDDLTGLLNRRSFNRRLKQLIEKSRKNGKSIGLILIDLDHFKLVNDTFGHPAGDHVLRVLSKHVKSCLPDAGFASRLGGDEFAVAIGNMEDAGDVVEIAEKIISLADSPVHYAGQPINSGMSIGCAVFPRDANDIHELMRCADIALYRLKNDGRGRVGMFDNQPTFDKFS
jgi:diguanylate cyclase (GGDEF)-like protein/PAS domain S-box-containing protein